jgi:hypothetical protein
LLAASWCRVSLLNCPALPGSGKSGTPRERMQRAKASALAFADPPAFDEPPEVVDDGLPSHAAGSRPKAAVAMIMAAVRGASGHARRRRCGPEVLWFTVISS